MASTVRQLVGAAFLLFQVTMMVRARFDADRYFCWAPHDAQNEYEIVAIIDGRPLDDIETFQRYRVPKVGVDPRAIEHIKDVVRERERRAQKPAHVTVRYHTNGGAPQRWEWPER